MRTPVFVRMGVLLCVCVCVCVCVCEILTSWTVILITPISTVRIAITPVTGVNTLSTTSASELTVTTISCMWEKSA